MSRVILDASALLALLNSENGKEVVNSLLSQSVISAVNMAEVMTELQKKLNIDPSESKEMLKAIIQVIPFDFDQSVITANLQKDAKSLGLSLGDRACIALGIILNAPIYTADKIWVKLENIDVSINLIR